MKRFTRHEDSPHFIEEMVTGIYYQFINGCGNLPVLYLPGKMDVSIRSAVDRKWRKL